MQLTSICVSSYCWILVYTAPCRQWLKQTMYITYRLKDLDRPYNATIGWRLISDISWLYLSMKDFEQGILPELGNMLLQLKKSYTICIGLLKVVLGHAVYELWFSVVLSDVMDIECRFLCKEWKMVWSSCSMSEHCTIIPLL